jgi:mono/diheme cytochrome c family protein
MAAPQNPDSTDIDRLHSAVKREKADLPAGSEPAPTWALFAGLIAAVFAGGQFGNATNSLSIESTSAYAMQADPRSSGGGDVVALDAFQKAMKNGATGYAVCGGCHQASGAGVPGQYPPLAGSEFVTGGTERIARIVMHGLTGPVTVKGAAYNFAGGMPAQGGTMNDQAIADVLTYIRNTWGNEGTMVTKEMVAKVRETEKARSSQWTAAELEAHAKANMPGEIPAGPGATAAAAPAAAPAAK